MPRAREPDLTSVCECIDQANALREAGDFEGALHLLEDALQRGRNTARIYYGMGNVYADSNDLAQAERAYKRALDVDPDFTNAMHNLAVIYRRDGRISDFVRTYRRSCRLYKRGLREDSRHRGAMGNHRLVTGMFGWLFGGVVVVALVWLVMR